MHEVLCLYPILVSRAGQVLVLIEPVSGHCSPQTVKRFITLNEKSLLLFILWDEYFNSTKIYVIGYI